MLHSYAARTTILATSSALALMTAALGDHAHAEGKLDASYTISFARIVGDDCSPSAGTQTCRVSRAGRYCERDDYQDQIGKRPRHLVLGAPIARTPWGFCP